MSDHRHTFSRKAMELVDEILGYEVEIDRLADENDQLKEQNKELIEVLELAKSNLIHLFIKNQIPSVYDDSNPVIRINRVLDKLKGEG